MNLEKALEQRSNNCCELCSNTKNLQLYRVPPSKKEILEESLVACNTCIAQMNDPELMDENHWRCLNDSMWSEHKVVQIMVWRLLFRLRAKGWPQDLLDMMYLDEDDLVWAKAAGDGDEQEDKIVHRDSNGVIIEAGDSVVLIKDLPVKGSSMIAKRGTAVRRVSLDHENADYIEGKVDGQHIVIITKYVKKI